MEEGSVALMIEYMDGGSLQDIVDAGGCDGYRGRYLGRDRGRDRDRVILRLGGEELSPLWVLRTPNSSQCCQSIRCLPVSKAHHSTTLLTTVLSNTMLVSPVNFPLFDVPLFHLLPSPSPSLSCSRAMVVCLVIVRPPHVCRAPVATSVASTPSAMHRAHTFVGTATYMAPERIDGREYSYPSDVCAFGLSLMAVAIGRLPIDTQGGYWTILHRRGREGGRKGGSEHCSQST